MVRRKAIGSTHLFRAGILATVLTVYQVASNDGLLRLIQTRTVASGDATIPTGISTSYQSEMVHPESSSQSTAGYDIGNNRQPSNSFSSQGDMRVYFSPQGGCTEAIIGEINQRNANY